MSTKEILKTLIPINSLTEDNFRELVKTVEIERLSRKSVLFKEGDVDKHAIYLLKGEISLISKSRGINRKVVAGSENALYALAQLKPRQVTGRAVTNVTITRVDDEFLDRLLTWDQVSGIEVVEMDGDEDTEWMLQMLRSKAFERLPAANINEMFSRLETIPVKAGQVILKQDDPGDYYYIIREGKCSVTRKNADGKVIILNQLSAGDQFGEEALLSDAPRNATIVMMAEGVLMRLAKKDFLELLKAPLIDWVTQDQAQAMLKQGAGLLDVRTEDEHRQGAISGSLSTPLYKLRLAAEKLDAKRKYIVYCQTGSRSGVAAFMLNQRGFDTYALKGGLAALQGRSPAAAVASS